MLPVPIPFDTCKAALAAMECTRPRPRIGKCTSDTVVSWSRGILTTASLALLSLPYMTIRFSGLVGALGGGLSGLGGYNGLPSVMSGLDESMSDIEARKKYPFELEKAMHNVMFIQHHMQRQDEFNAVSRDRW